MNALRDAAKLAQFRASGRDKAAIKAARSERRADTITDLIERYVSAADMRKLKKRGCLHSVDFPEKRDQSLRGRRSV